MPQRPSNPPDPKLRVIALRLQTGYYLNEKIAHATAGKILRRTLASPR